MSITWRKDGVMVNTGIRDFGRRLVISLPAVSDTGYYECEASLRSSSIPSVTAGAFLHVLGKQPTTYILTLHSWAAESKLSKYCISMLTSMSRSKFFPINASVTVWKRVKEKKNFFYTLKQHFYAFPHFDTEYPVFVKEPPSHISAEMEKVVDIPCQARG